MKHLKVGGVKTDVAEVKTCDRIQAYRVDEQPKLPM